MRSAGAHPDWAARIAAICAAVRPGASFFNAIANSSTCAGAGRKAILVAFLDDHSRLVTAARWGYAENVPPAPMLALSLAIEGPSRIGSSLDLSAPDMIPALIGLAYTVVLGTIVGSGLWSWLMARHPAGVVAPFSMLVPIVGMSTAWLVLDEEISPGKAAGAALVVAGVLLGSHRPAQTSHFTPRHDPSQGLVSR